jgi:branched-chain amino acid transport system ATP-binding protein
MSRLRSYVGGVSPFPLLILAGLNFMDWADQSAYNVLLPNIRDALHLTNTGILLVSAIGGGMGLLLTVPFAWAADRYNRVHIALVGAAIWALFSFSTGLATFVAMLVIVRCGTAVGQAVVFPTHNSLLADFYPIKSRPKVYSSHALGNVTGQIFGVLVGAGLATLFNWRVPFIVFAFPVALLVVLGVRIHEPPRGHHERAEAGIDAETEAAAQAEPPPSYAEAYRMVWKIGTLRRIFVALPFLAASIIGFAAFASLQYEQTFHRDAVQRAWITIPVLFAQVGGLVLGARLATRFAARGVEHVFKLLGYAAVVASVSALGFAVAPNVWLAATFNALIVASLAIVGPGVLSSLSLAIPSRARAIGFSIGALFVLPGLLVLPVVGWVGDTWGLRWGLALMTPVFLIGGLVISSVGRIVGTDIADVWTGAATRAELLLARQRGELTLLLVRKLDVRYGDVRVLFDVDIEVDEGEIVALLGTNGAGKSTLLGAIAGTVEASNGAVVFDGRDITHAPPEEIAALGIAQVPGGKGVFPTLTVAENLRAASWLVRRDPEEAARRVTQVHELFPVLTDRLHDPAANLSGGQQQMLALGMALVSRPRLLVIDELSLGLAPLVVEQLLEVVRAIRDQGTTIIVVEQSVNVALTIADRAYFMEKGEVRYSGPTADLLDRPDLVRSVYLASAGRDLGDGNGHAPAATAAGEATAAEPVALAIPAKPVLADSAPAPNGSATPAGPALAVSELTVFFGGIAAVDDVSLEFAPREIVGLIGPNGAGKTTLFDLISGFLPATRGRVELAGRNVTNLGAAERARLGLGRSFQDSRLFDSLTVAETLAVALERFIDVGDPLNAIFRLPMQQVSERAVEERVDELIDLFGLGSFRSKLLRELSTGSRRIVDLACVVAHGPSVVLLDEPSSGIAQREAEALAPLLLRLRDHLDATLLVVEHDLSLVSTVSDRLVALDQGRVVVTGSAVEVLEHPEVIAAYLGTGDTARARSGARVSVPAAPDPTDVEGVST